MPDPLLASGTTSTKVSPDYIIGIQTCTKEVRPFEPLPLSKQAVYIHRDSAAPSFAVQHNSGRGQSKVRQWKMQAKHRRIGAKNRKTHFSTHRLMVSSFRVIVKP